MSTAGLVVTLVAAIALVVFLIVAVKLHASLALTVSAVGVALVTQVPLGEIAESLEEGVGGTLGFLTLIIGFGAILGKLMEVSGGAERLATSMLNVMGKKRATLVMALLGLVAGIPVFVEVGFVLLVPLVFVVAKEAGISRVKVGIPLAISLMIVHCILPPHPAATAIAGILDAEIGLVIVYGLLVALPAALVGGPLFANVVIGNKPPQLATLEDEHTVSEGVESDRELPGFGITLVTILLPLLIMVSRTILTQFFDEGSTAGEIVDFVGNPIFALLVSVFFAYWSLGLRRGRTLPELLALTDASFQPIGGVLLIIGAGGAFNAVLVASGIGTALADALSELPVSPIILAWMIALVLHFAVGSATVAMISAAGIVLPLLAANPSISPEVMAIAVGAGAIGMTQVTDSLFWMVKEFLHLSVPETIKTLTLGTTVASIVALFGALALNLVI